MYNNLMCFFTDPGIIPKKHIDYFIKVDPISIDNEQEQNNVFVYKQRGIGGLKEDDSREKEESQSLNTSRTDQNNSQSEIVIKEDDNTCYPDIFK